MKSQISNKEFLKRLEQSAKKEKDRIDNLSKTELITEIINYRYYAGGKISKAPPPLGESSTYYEKLLLDIDNDKNLLHTQSIGTIKKTHSELCKEFLKTFSVEEQRKNKLAEDKMPWNTYNSIANYQFWSKMDLWTIHEGITLLLEKEPKVISSESINENYYYGSRKKSQFQKQYESILSIANTSINTLKLKPNNTPTSFIQWAGSKNILVPEAMRISVKELTNIPNYENLYLQLKKQLDNKPETIDTNNSNSSKPTKETDNLHKTIAAITMLFVDKTKATKYGTSDNPNKKAIFNDLDSLLTKKDLNKNGLGESSISDRISKGIKLIKKL